MPHWLRRGNFWVEFESALVADSLGKTMHFEVLECHKCVMSCFPAS